MFELEAKRAENCKTSQTSTCSLDISKRKTYCLLKIDLHTQVKVIK